MVKLLAVILIAVVFFVCAFLILLDQYQSLGVWFQSKDIHHETFALSSAALGFGILIGAIIANEKFPPN